MTINKKKQKLSKQVNPFTVNLPIPVVELEFKNQYKREGEFLISVTKEVEYTPYHKVYRSKELRERVISLKSTTLKLYTWIQYSTRNGEDFIYIDKERACNELQIRDRTFRAIIKELQATGFISPTTEREIYWLNPYYFFVGDRVSKYPRNIIQYESKKSKKFLEEVKSYK